MKSIGEHPVLPLDQNCSKCGKMCSVQFSLDNQFVCLECTGHLAITDTKLGIPDHYSTETQPHHKNKFSDEKASEMLDKLLEVTRGEHE